jgi:hypothetical protein
MKRKNLQEKGEFFENDDYRIEINYSDEAVEQELIKIKLKKSKTVDFSSGQLLSIITKNLRNKELALALSDYELNMKVLSAIEVMRTVHFKSDKDYKAGEEIKFSYSQMYPYFLALFEEGYGIAKTKGEIVGIPLSVMEEARESMLLKNKELAEAINKPTLEAAAQVEKNEK